MASSCKLTLIFVITREMTLIRKQAPYQDFGAEIVSKGMPWPTNTRQVGSKQSVTLTRNNDYANPSIILKNKHEKRWKCSWVVVNRHMNDKNEVKKIFLHDIDSICKRCRNLCSPGAAIQLTPNVTLVTVSGRWMFAYLKKNVLESGPSRGLQWACWASWNNPTKETSYRDQGRSLGARIENETGSQIVPSCGLREVSCGSHRDRN